MTGLGFFAMLALTSSIAAPAAKPRTDWVGETVFIKKSNTALLKREAVKSYTPVGRLISILYVVSDVEKGYLPVMQEHKPVWVLKEDMVRLKDAPDHYTKMHDEEPENASWLAMRGWASFRLGKKEDALKDYAEAIRLQPMAGSWYSNRGLIYTELKKYDEAIADFTTAIDAMPDYPLTYRNRAVALLKKKEYAKAAADYEKAAELAPESADMQNGLAWVLCTAPDDKVRDGKRAVIAALKACELTEHKNGGFLDTLAAAYAEIGEFDKAVEWQQKAVQTGNFPAGDLADAKKRVDLYKAKKAYREE